MALLRASMAVKRANMRDDSLEAGVINPASVLRCDIQMAAGVAASLLTKNVLIEDKPEKEVAKIPADMELC